MTSRVSLPLTLAACSIAALTLIGCGDAQNSSNSDGSLNSSNSTFLAPSSSTHAPTSIVPSPSTAKPVNHILFEGRTLILLGEAIAEDLMGPAIAAASASSGGKPAVLVMSKLLGEFGFDDAVQDYLRRYQPERTWTIGVERKTRKKLGDMHWHEIDAKGLFETSCLIARDVWKQAAELVLVNAGSYEDALIAAPLAAKRSVPLVLVGAGSSGQLAKLIEDLAVRSVWTVGSVEVETPVPQTHLHGSVGVASAVGSTEYVALTNPSDRSLSKYRSLSLTAPLIAATRGGVVLNLKDDSNSRRLSTADGSSSGTEEGTASASTGNDADDASSHGGSGLLHSPSSPPTTATPASTHSLTASEVTDQVKAYMSVVGMAKYLAIVGGPDAIPFHVFHSGVGNMETKKVHDWPYADLDNDPFLDLAIGRLVAKNLASMSLIISRIATYEQLRNGVWDSSSALAGDLQEAMYVFTPALANVGFKEERLTQPQHKGVLEKSAIIHQAHSWYTDLGGFFSASSEALLAPAVVTSAGCSPAGIDRSGPYASVALHLLHQGAVSFMGAPHNAVTRSKLTHHAFWDALLRGETLGNAFAEAINDWVVILEEDHKGKPTHAPQNIVLFGDPAFRMHIPQKPAVPPARVEEQGDSVTVYGPTEWTLNSETSALAREWNWPGKLHYFGAPGAVQLYYWAGKYDKSKQFLFARFRTKSANSKLEKTSEATAGLGWTGRVHVDEHADGSRTLLWRVSLLDFDVETGSITAQFSSQSFRIIDG